jgi:DNA helicase-2/ATP-dependent DNA helicase PcrA
MTALERTMTLFEHLEAVRNGAKLTVREKRTPSVYQQAILDDVRSGTNAITVEATAGSGKTSLLEMIAQVLDEDGIVPSGGKIGFLAFNQHIVKELKKRLSPTFDIRTVSSLGHLICKEQLPDLSFEPRKYEDLTQSVVQDAGVPSPAARRELQDRLGACLNLHVGHALGLDTALPDWVAAMDAVDAPILGAEEILHRLTGRILRQGLAMLQQQHVMSFTDQVLAPLTFGWRLGTPYDFLLIDEAQDLSAAQLFLLQAATSAGTRIVGVGDSSQSIYAFSGSDMDSVEKFTTTFGAMRRPLSISYRCPQRHVALARPFTTAIEAAPKARLGSLDDLTGDEFMTLARPGDLALCRTNAPLIDWCYRLVSEGIPAVVRGRDLAKSLTALARDAATFDGQRVHREKVKDSLPLTEFVEQLNAYASLLADKMMREAQEQGRDPGLRIAGLADRVGALMRVMDAGNAATLRALTEDIRTLFQGDPERSVVLSTVHRAKGLEADRVFILEPGLLPHPKAQTPQAVNAERCLQFVAYTRSKRDLFFVDADVSCIPDAWRGRE